MSFIGDIVGNVAKAVLPTLISAEFPFTALIPGLNNMVANLAGDLLKQGIDQIMKESGSPLFMINDAMKLIQQAVGSLQQQCEPAVQDHCQSSFGDKVQHSVTDFISDLLNKLRAELGCGGKGGKGGKGGAGGAGGAGGSGGPVTLRDLAKALGALEEQEAAKLKKKVDIATNSLSEDGSKGQTKSQFSAMEDVKAESQIQATLSSMISEVIKNFGQAMQSSGRA